MSIETLSPPTPPHRAVRRRAPADRRHALPELRSRRSRSGCRMSVRPVSGHSRSPTTTALIAATLTREADRGARARHLALCRAAPRRCAPGPLAPGRLDAAACRRDRLAPGPGRGAALDQGRHAQSVAELQGPRRGGRGGPRRGVRRRGARLRVDRQPRRRDRRRGRGRRAAGLRLHPGRPRAGQGRPRARLRRDRRARSTGPTTTSTACASRSPTRPAGASSTSTCGRSTPRAPRPSPTRSPSRSAGGRRTSSWRRSRRGRCSPASRAGSRSSSSSGSSRTRPIRFVGGQASGCSPVATAFERGTDVIEPVREPDTFVRSLAIGNPADGRYAVELARDSGGSIEAIEDADDRGRDPRRGPARGHLPGDRRRRDARPRSPPRGGGASSGPATRSWPCSPATGSRPRTPGRSAHGDGDRATRASPGSRRSSGPACAPSSAGSRVARREHGPDPADAAHGHRWREAGRRRGRHGPRGRDRRWSRPIPGWRRSCSPRTAS